PSAPKKARPKGRRMYQRGLSKQIAKLNKYRPSGNTQRKGITAMSWHNLLVVASNRADAHAGKITQSRRVKTVGPAASPAGRCSPPTGLGLIPPVESNARVSLFRPCRSAFKSFTAQYPQQHAKAPSPHPQMVAWALRVKWFSKKTG